MQFGDEPESSNFRDDTGRSFGGFGGGGNMLGCLLPLIASRFGIGGVVILVIGYFLLSSLGGLGGGVQQPVSQQGATAAQSRLDPNTKHFTLQVLKSTEDVWTKLLAQRGVRYTPTELVFYNEEDNSGCGAAQSAMGPFYCPTDTDIYLDTEFFSELANKFQAPGDFAEAYVIAHEVGHHVQDLLGARPGAFRPGSGEQHGRQSHPGRDRASGRLLCGSMGGKRSHSRRAAGDAAGRF
jgi:predicted metalloprotease